MTPQEAIEMIRDDMRLHHDYLPGTYRQALNMAVTALEKLDSVPPAQPNNQVNLCDSCKYSYPDCPSEVDDVIFGNGKGNDNICACNKYLQSAQPEHALKDCRNCKHGQYNDHWDTYFCYNSGNCEDWNLWESDIIPSAQPERKTCNLCKYYKGVHRVQGFAPCDYWKIGGVLYDDYCSRWEKFDE